MNNYDEEIEDNFYRFERLKKRKNKDNEINWDIEERDKEDEDISDTKHEFGFDNIENPKATYIPEYYN